MYVGAFIIRIRHRIVLNRIQSGRKPVRDNVTEPASDWSEFRISGCAYRQAMLCSAQGMSLRIVIHYAPLLFLNNSTLPYNVDGTILHP